MPYTFTINTSASISLGSENLPLINGNRYYVSLSVIFGLGNTAAGYMTVNIDPSSGIDKTPYVNLPVLHNILMFMLLVLIQI